MVFALDEYNVKGPKTKEFTALMSKLPVKRSLLVVLPVKDETFQKSTRNIPNVKTILVNYLNPYDVLLYENIMFLESSIKKAEELFLK
jgi:large subunit ribosomal protein L4